MTTQRKQTIQKWLPHVLQVLVILGAVIGFALASEHRITVIEECAKNTANVLSETTKTVSELQKNQIRIITILDSIDKRHEKK